MTFSMRNALLLSTGFHIFVFLLIITSTLFQHTTPPVQKYFVRIITLPPEPEPAPVATTNETKVEEPPKPAETRVEEKEVKKEKTKEGTKASESRQKKTGTSKQKRVSPPITLDNPDFDSPFYISLIYTKVTNNWLNPTPRAIVPLVTVIYFKIRRDGKLGEIRIEKRSGNPAFDEAAYNAVRLSEPFPPLPDEFQQDMLGVHFEFEHLPEQ